MIQEESPSKAEAQEKSRLSKLPNVSQERKKGMSWLSRFTQGKK